MSKDDPLPPRMNAPPDELCGWLAGRGLIPRAAVWAGLHGGRTNRIWKVTADGKTLICKLYDPAQVSPLFPNDPAAEALALGTLAGTGLAPHLVASGESPAGAFLIYDYVAGAPWAGSDAELGTLLRRLHDCPAPPGLRGQTQGAARLIQEARAMRDQLPDALQNLLPEPPALPADPTQPVAPVFLHGDPVAANVVATPDGPVLIDWQCPALGDPCDDIAIVLSPAMRALYGPAGLPPADPDGLLAAYGRPEVAARYRRLAPYYHYRMAVFCAWKAARGAEEYRPMIGAELDHLRTANA